MTTPTRYKRKKRVRRLSLPKSTIADGYKQTRRIGYSSRDEGPSEPFHSEWAVAGDATARTITLPLVQNRAEGALEYNCVIDWGDDTALSLVTSYNDANRIHTYASDGTYFIKIYGIMDGWSLGGHPDRDKLEKVIHWGGGGAFEGFKYLASGFNDCDALTAIPNEPIPARDNGVESDGFTSLFQSCSKITAIPALTFTKHPLAASFGNALRGCPALLALPAGLFINNTAATDFNGLCRGDSGLLTVAADLFDSAVGVTTFMRAFDGCTSLASLPPGLFDNNVAVTSFQELCDGCTSLETTPSGLFRYNVAAVDFEAAFRNCNKHQQNADLFYADGEQSARFLNQNPDFRDCFNRASFTGTQGTAPDLWNCDFGSGSPASTDCWEGAGNDAASLSNYASIPAGWL